MNAWRSFLAVLSVLCLQQSCGTSAESSSLEDWEGKVRRAASHEEWEHIVRRSAESARQAHHLLDDTAHIVNVQEYYRSILDAGWDDDSYMLQEGQHLDRATAQSVLRAVTQQTKKPVPGRYIVMLQSDTDDHTLDRTMAVLQEATRTSQRKVRATDMAVLRHVGVGFTATLNQRAVQLVSPFSLHVHV